MSQSEQNWLIIHGFAHVQLQVQTRYGYDKDQTQSNTPPFFHIQFLYNYFK